MPQHIKHLVLKEGANVRKGDNSYPLGILFSEILSKGIWMLSRRQSWSKYTEAECWGYSTEHLGKPVPPYFLLSQLSLLYIFNSYIRLYNCLRAMFLAKCYRRGKPDKWIHPIVSGLDLSICTVTPWAKAKHKAGLGDAEILHLHLWRGIFLRPQKSTLTNIRPKQYL